MKAALAAVVAAFEVLRSTGCSSVSIAVQARGRACGRMVAFAKDICMRQTPQVAVMDDVQDWQSCLAVAKTC